MTTTIGRIPGDLRAALNLLCAYDQAGHQLAGATLAHLLVDPDAPEPTLRNQLHRLTLEAHSLAQGLARISRTWQQTSAEAAEHAAEIAEQAEIARLHIDRPAPARAVISRPEPAIPTGESKTFPPACRHRWSWQAPLAGLLTIRDLVVALAGATVGTALFEAGWSIAAAVTR